MRVCGGCIWFQGKCLKNLRTFRLLPCPEYNRVPKLIKNYIEGIEKFTGIPKKKIMKSESVKNYIEKFKEVNL